MQASGQGGGGGAQHVAVAGERGRTWATCCSEDQTQPTFNGTCPLMVHFLHRHLLRNLCRVPFAAAAHRSLCSSKSHISKSNVLQRILFLHKLSSSIKPVIISRKEIGCSLARPVFSKTNLSNIRCFCHLLPVVINLWVRWFV